MVIIGDPRLISFRLLFTRHLWVNWQKNLCFVENRLLIIISYQSNHRLILWMSFFEVKKLYRKMSTPIICKEFLINLDTFKSCDLIGYKKDICQDLSKCLKMTTMHMTMRISLPVDVIVYVNHVTILFMIIMWPELWSCDRHISRNVYWVQLMVECKN